MDGVPGRVRVGCLGGARCAAWGGRGSARRARGGVLGPGRIPGVAAPVGRKRRGGTREHREGGRLAEDEPGAAGLHLQLRQVAPLQQAGEAIDERQQ